MLYSLKRKKITLTGGERMPIEFDITLTAKDMYRFNLYQTYSGFQGWSAFAISIASFAAAWMTYGDIEVMYTILYTAFGFIFLFYVPISLYIRSKNSFRASKVLCRPLHYAVGEEGFAVSQGEESAFLAWEQVYKIAATRSNVLVYSTRRNAYVIPRVQLGADMTRFGHWQCRSCRNTVSE